MAALLDSIGRVESGHCRAETKLVSYWMSKSRRALLLHRTVERQACSLFVAEGQRKLVDGGYRQLAHLECYPWRSAGDVEAGPRRAL